MLLGPIFSIELVTSARHARHYLLRVAYAMLLLLVLWTSYETSVHLGQASIQTVANITRDFFAGFAFMQIVAVLVLTPAMVASSIAGERERRTIDDLLTSQLSSADIILGKLSARLIHVVLIVAAGVPVLSIAMLLGGIGPGALVCVMLITLSTLAAAGALTIAVSTRRDRTRDAIQASYGLLVALLALPPMMMLLVNVPATSWWRELLVDLGQVGERLVSLNPLYVIGSVALGLGQGTVNWRVVGEAVGSHLALAAVLLASTTYALRRRQARTQVKAAWRWSLRRLAWRPAVWARSMVWKEMFTEQPRGRPGKLSALMQLVLVVGIGIAFVDTFLDALDMPDRSRFVESGAILANLVACVGLVLAVARSATQITSEKERDCWVSLLSTPLSAAEILTAKLLGNLYSARWITLLLAGIAALVLVADVRAIGLVVIFALTWLLFLVYAGCLGLYVSLRAKNSTRAIALAVFVGVFLGGMYLIFLPMLDLRENEEIAFVACIPMLFAIPTECWISVHRGWGSQGLERIVLVAVAGIALYAIATAYLGFRCLRDFESRAGRTDEAEGEQRQAADVPGPHATPS